MFKPKQSEDSVIKGVFIAYFILLFHVALLGLVGVLVLFFSGIMNFLPWILLGGLFMMFGSGYMLLRYVRKKSGSLVKILSMPEFRGKNIEVNLLGGMASFKIQDSQGGSSKIEHDPSSARLPGPFLNETDRAQNQDLERLSGLLENNIITRDEYQRAKQRLLDQ